MRRSCLPPASGAAGGGLASDRPPVLFHAHCHQKALADPGASLKLLRLAGYEAELVNAACCGMAGAFGYEREHYQLSRAAAEASSPPLGRAPSAAYSRFVFAFASVESGDFAGALLHLEESLRLYEPDHEHCAHIRAFACAPGSSIPSHHGWPQARLLGSGRGREGRSRRPAGVELVALNEEPGATCPPTSRGGISRRWRSSARSCPKRPSPACGRGER